MRTIFLGVFLLSAAGLAFEVTLTRVFALAQWYHFAFMSVSLALLGFGASGSVLSLLRGATDRLRAAPERVLGGLAALFSLGVLASYLVVNFLPFDSYRVAWDRAQLIYFALYYLSLALPFFFGGLAVGGLLSVRPELTARIYAANLVGSAAGCLVAVGALPLLGGTGTVLFCAVLGAVSAVVFAWRQGRQRWLYVALATAVIVLLALSPAWLEIRLSEYKSLSHRERFPDAQVVFRGWNAYSRVDVLDSQSIRAVPGLSLGYLGSLPRQRGLFIDGDGLSGIIDGARTTGQETANLVDSLPTSLAYRLRPDARALILEPRGGLDVHVALQSGAAWVTVAESNGLVVDAVRTFGGGLYDDRRVTPVMAGGRSYLRRSPARYDVIHLALTGEYRAVTSGAYSLSEDYLLTAEAFADYLAHLDDGGLLVISRWLQAPPSESLRAWALAVTAAEKSGAADPKRQLVAIRGWATSTILIKNGDWTAEEVDAVKDFCAAHSFDLMYYPGIAEEEANRFAVHERPIYYRAFTDLLTADDRGRFHKDYPFAVRPPTDDRPFFFHFFTWRQTRAILEQLGQTWQPFGGSGYLVLVALLALAVIASAAFILLPLALRRRTRLVGPKGQVFAYFALLGLGYLFVEIPLMQRFILFLDQPVYAFAAVLFGLLLSSGLGSALAPRLPLRRALALLAALALLYPFLLPLGFSWLLGWPLAGRLAATVAALAPLGFLMGVPFPRGIALVERRSPDLIPWAWGINGCASVIASVLAAMLALSAGFSWVLIAGAGCYALALLVATRLQFPTLLAGQ
jgi:MFS family permease